MKYSQSASSAGFKDTVHDSQACFRLLMDAFSYPALAHDFPARACAWGAMPASIVTLLLTLADQDTPVWFDQPYADDDEVRACVAFHCGAPVVAQTDRAAFAFISDPARIGDFSRFMSGDPDFPDRSTTVVVQAGGINTGSLMFTGPGIREPQGFGADGLLSDFVAQWRRNRRSFPLGLDLIFVNETKVVALPRSLRLQEV